MCEVQRVGERHLAGSEDVVDPSLSGANAGNSNGDQNKGRERLDGHG